MNNSQMKAIIKSKGFLYGNSQGMVVLVKPNSNRVEHLSKQTLAWLETFPDVVIPHENFLGRYIGDQVQVFDPIDDYQCWGQIGRVVGLENRGEKGFVHVSFTGYPEDYITVPSNAVVVLNREGVVSLKGMTSAERDLQIAKMLNLPATPPEVVDEDVPTPGTICECDSPSCGLPLNDHEWDALNKVREDMKATHKWNIISNKCKTPIVGKLVRKTESLLLIEKDSGSLTM